MCCHGTDEGEQETQRPKEELERSFLLRIADGQSNSPQAHTARDGDQFVLEFKTVARLARNWVRGWNCRVCLFTADEVARELLLCAV